MTINIGMGVSSRERRLVALDTIAQRQQVIVEGGGLGTLINPENLHNQLIDHAEAMGVEGSRYYMNPAEAQPKPEEGPSPQDQAMMLTAQAQVGVAQAQNDRNKVEMAKAQSAEKIRIAELQASQRDLEMRRQIEAMKADRDAMKREMDSAATGTKAMLDAEIKTRDQEIKVAQMRLADEQETARREADMYKALLASSTTLNKAQMEIVGVEGGPVEEPVDVQAIVSAMSQELGELRQQLAMERDKAMAPKVVRRDAKGLIVAIGDVPVQRDASGRVEVIG